jgi:integrase
MNALVFAGKYLEREKAAALFAALDDNYTSNTKVFFDYLRQRGLQYSPESILGYAEWLHEEHDGKKYAARTINHYLSGVKHRLRFALEHSPGLSDEERGAVEHVIVELRTKTEKINQRGANLERCMSFDEMTKVIAYARKVNPRLALIAEFLGSTGCRISETLQVLVSECKPTRADEVSVMLHGKGRKARTVYVPAELYRRIRKTFGGRTYLFAHSSTQRLYSRSYVSMTLRRLSAKAIGRPVSAHVFRHSYVTDQLERFPGKIAGISKYIGHAQVSITTDIYLHGSLTAADIAGMAPRFTPAGATA